MKILYLNPFSGFAAVRQKNLARALRKKGHDITLMLPEKDAYSGWKKTKETVPFTIIHPKQWSSRIPEIGMLPYLPSGFFLKGTYDVVHAFRPLPFSGLLGYIIARKKGIPFVLELGDIEWETMRDLGTHPPHRLFFVRWLEKFLVKHADAVTVMNKHVSSYVKEKYGRTATVVSNGVDTMLFSPTNTSLRASYPEKILLAFLGKLDNISHIKNLVPVMALLPKKYGLLIIGEGKRKGDLVKEAKKQGVERRVHFTGRIPQKEVPTYLSTADILLAPFNKTKGVDHASNLKIFEYMSMGKPIVAGGVGEIPSLLKGRGIVYTPGNIQSLVKGIKSANPEMGKKARAYVAQYDWNVLVNNLEKLYGELNDKRTL